MKAAIIFPTAIKFPVTRDSENVTGSNQYHAQV